MHPMVTPTGILFIFINRVDNVKAVNWLYFEHYPSSRNFQLSNLFTVADLQYQVSRENQIHQLSLLAITLIFRYGFCFC